MLENANNKPQKLELLHIKSLSLLITTKLK